MRRVDIGSAISAVCEVLRGESRRVASPELQLLPDGTVWLGSQLHRAEYGVVGWASVDGIPEIEPGDTFTDVEPIESYALHLIEEFGIVDELASGGES